MLASELPLSRLLDALQELTQGMDDYEQRSIMLEAANRLAVVDGLAVEMEMAFLPRWVAAHVRRIFDALNGKLRSVGEGVG